MPVLTKARRRVNQANILPISGRETSLSDITSQLASRMGAFPASRNGLQSIKAPQAEEWATFDPAYLVQVTSDNDWQRPPIEHGTVDPRGVFPGGKDRGGFRPRVRIRDGRCAGGREPGERLAYRPG